MTEKNGPKELVNFAGAAEDAIAEAVRAYREAGFTDIALVHLGGGHQETFLKGAAQPLLDLAAPNPSDEREKT
ncbi:MAG: hypothetical protein ACSLE6_01720 [Mycobacterium sp.]